MRDCHCPTLISFSLLPSGVKPKKYCHVRSIYSDHLPASHKLHLDFLFIPCSSYLEVIRAHARAVRVRTQELCACARKSCARVHIQAVRVHAPPAPSSRMSFIFQRCSCSSSSSSGSLSSSCSPSLRTLALCS